jgi:2-methylcitrate dehydratase PrpD
MSDSRRASAGPALAELSRFVATLTLSDVPPAAIARARLHVLDAFNSAIGAMRTPGGRAVAHAFDLIDREERATIVATGSRSSVNTAAFVNAQMSTNLDMGAVLFFSQGLGGLSLFGPLALAEVTGGTGARLLECVIAGYEVSGRVALALSPPYRVTETQVTNGSGGPPNLRVVRWVGLAAAIAAAKMRSLDEERTAHAIATMIASLPVMFGGLQVGDEAGMVKYGLAGHIAAAGLASALLAEQGFTGNLRLLDDPVRLETAMGLECVDPGALTRDLGTRWLIAEAGFKRYPSGTHNQQGVHTVERLMREHRIDPDDIRSIRVGRALGTTGVFARRDPEDQIASQFSLPFVVAAMALGLPVRDWHEHVANPRVRALAARVQLVQDADMMKATAAMSPAEQRVALSYQSVVSIETSRGVIEGRSDYGEVSEDEIVEKTRHHADGILTKAVTDRLVQSVLALERVGEVSELFLK